MSYLHAKLPWDLAFIIITAVKAAKHTPIGMLFAMISYLLPYFLPMTAPMKLAIVFTMVKKTMDSNKSR